MFIDIGCCRKKKYNQNAYGDCFISKRYKDKGRVTGVLSDGLGSGIKANILACMTATMLLKFIEAQSDIKTACEIIMNSLPVCKVRKISYSTFSAIDCDEDGNAKIVEEGNPEFLWIRNNKILEPDYEIITSKTFTNRKMRLYKIKLEKGDRIIFCSDGVTQAALGTKELKSGVGREGLIKIVLAKLKDFPEISSVDLTNYIVRQIQIIEPEHKLKDDTSSACFYFREPRESVLFTGPPYNAENDRLYAESFYNFNGKKAIAGGTTANLIARELNLEIDADVNINIGQLPGIYHMKGVDLVTEGILTLTKTVEYLENQNIKDDAAGKLVKFLLDTDEIKFMVGVKLNQAHYDPALPVEMEVRKNVVKKIAKLLEERYNKKTEISFI
ncbi:MAG: SpoIIE family protein phosphatase [Candidatus Gastranaerophilales bacterium]|nr:SpoIIE family protein phosphatase [Candidatus Gastranaerophilales bacterium]